jgi:thymidylate synthase
MHHYRIVRGGTLREHYSDLVNHIIENGRPQSPRGVPTREITNFTLELESAESATFLNGIGRNASQDVLAAELMQWAAGVSDLKQLVAASPVFAKFSDDGDRLYGAYGPRAYSGLRRAVQMLSEDPSSRQATVSIWSNLESTRTRDLPCTISWSFMIRDGKLHMTTYMRSNDVWTGVTYDVPSMARIQSMMAWALGVELGSYTHIAQSMHIYESDFFAAAKLHDPTDVVVDPPFFHHVLARSEQTPTERWETMTSWCEAALAGAAAAYEFEPYAARLLKLGQNPHKCHACRYRLPQVELFCKYAR